MMHVTGSIVKLDLCEEALIILMHLVIFSGEGLGLDCQKQVEDTQTCYLNILIRLVTCGVTGLVCIGCVLGGRN